VAGLESAAPEFAAGCLLSGADGGVMGETFCPGTGSEKRQANSRVRVTEDRVSIDKGV
jgi:hypothetical protein